MMNQVIPLVLATAVCSAEAQVQIQVMPVPDDLKNLKPVAIAQSDLEERKRLDRIDSIIERFSLKKNEKFIYTGKHSSSPLLGPLDVVYKVYPQEDQLKVVRLNMRLGDARLYAVDPEDIQPYSSFSSGPLDARVASHILNPGASATRSKAYFKDWYDTYQSSRVKFARKIVASDACETVTSVDFYSFNLDVFTAFCGNGMTLSQTPTEIENGLPIDPAIKTWQVKRPR
ncbi:hypothetical protein M5G27_21965 [Pseudomonas shahriarae]|jgi:hypothetical protein|uniref:Uncharacterized protein n=1 Tax=Pseudomonas shahriarae TaxID=2745512 RepID=A0A9X4C4M4_9PSED|nr:hypothetical protein [Pseudomonas shahriarae]MDD1010150.1 hypothetical protein [Pseudomonas shahriarae]